MTTKILAVTTGLILTFALGTATAHDLFTALADTKITLDDAIHTAEQMVAGKLVKANLDIHSTPFTYKVAIADSNTRTITYIKVDPNSGKVLTSKTYHTDKPIKKTGYTVPGSK